MEKFVTRAINAYLSEYVEHLSSDQITVNIFHGMISVSDIVLKKKSLQGLWSGICVHSGNINRVILKCPATWLNRTAWSLTIDELHVFFKDEPEIKKDQCDEKVVRKLFWLQFSQMLSRILNNLQINIFDCHLKYCNDHRTFECRLRNVEFENTKDYLRRASQDSCQINEDVADEEEEEEEELEEEEEVHDGEEADREEEGGKDKLKACLLAIGIGLCLCVIGLCAACFTRSNEGLYVYRFEVPIGEVYRFWLTWRQGPSKSPLDLGKFVDYAFSRVADDAICSKHLRQEDAFEVHLGEADYIALLRDGQCACAAAESSDVSAGDVCRRSRHHREDKSRGDEAVSRGDAGDESVGSFARGKSDADNYGCETERLDLATLYQENDCGGGKNGAPDVSSADHEATWSRGDVSTTTRAATASKPASVGGPSQEQVNCRVAYSDSASSGYRAEVPKTAAADLSESEPGFTPDQSESEASASSSASSSDDDSPAEDASRTEGCRDGGPMTGKEMGGPVNYGGQEDSAIDEIAAKAIRKFFCRKLSTVDTTADTTADTTSDTTSDTTADTTADASHLLDTSGPGSHSQMQQGTSDDNTAANHPQTDIVGNDTQEGEQQDEGWKDYHGNDTDPMVTVVFRGPDNLRRQISLPNSSTLMTLVSYMNGLGFSQSVYELVALCPPRTISQLDLSVTLADAGFTTRETLYIQERKI